MFMQRKFICHHLMNKKCYLIGVVWAGDQQEDPCEGVLGWIGDLPGLRAWVKVTKEREFQRKLTSPCYYVHYVVL